LMRLLPFTEVAAAAAGGLRSELPGTLAPLGAAAAYASSGADMLSSMFGGSEEPVGSGMADESGDRRPTGSAEEPVGRGEEPTFAGGEGPTLAGDEPAAGAESPTLVPPG